MMRETLFLSFIYLSSPWLFPSFHCYIIACMCVHIKLDDSYICVFVNIPKSTPTNPPAW